ncbi:DoxX family membrane protein [Pedobacter sandarakinus]|uniref:DoxX family membrane protein n=1 Tax=Pedobacter sandarakinus TaxID=353156 RepID=UPI002245707A|nr:DoxX family membrane protein [Pedobacter sandarakinus]MCX2574861.1 DoxX family membrane protein [Pedobacter sandarakinus]
MLGIKSLTETRIVAWKARNGMNILRVCLGIIFIWFGMLKFFPGLSSAEEIAGRTILKLTFGWVKPAFSMPMLAVWECIIGIGLISKAWLRLTLILLYLQMAGTFLPLIFFPHETFNHSLLVPTLLGQYIIKNFVLISGGIVIGATIRGGKLTVAPTSEDRAARLEKRFGRVKRLLRFG